MMTNSENLTETVLTINAHARHDLLNWLNQILGYSEMLVEEAGSSGQDKLADDLGHINRAARRILEQLESLPSAQADTALSGANGLQEKKQIPHTDSNRNTTAIPDREISGNILVVDDNENNRDLLSRHLQRQGYRTVSADNGISALERLNEEPFDVVLLDVMMPDMDGYEVLERLKANKTLRQIPVIMISAHTDMEQVIKCIEMGAEDYLPKPFNPTLLKARIGAALEKKRLREQELGFISQVMQAEASLERQRTLIQAVAGVAHEINTPLGIACTGISIIENRLSLMKNQAQFNGDQKSDELFQDVLESTDLIKKNVIRAHQLVENFKKIAVNQMVEHKETVNLPHVLRDAIDLFKMSAKQARLDIELDVSGIKGSLDWLGYPGYLTQILLNFFQNIERYAYPEGCGGKVEIVVTDMKGRAEEDYFNLTVRDYGAGISPENIGKIFDPFFTTGRGKGGTGLGLSIVNNITTLALKGAIEVKSVPGTGTCFIVKFPKMLHN